MTFSGTITLSRGESTRRVARRALTVIELLVVIVIISVLAGSVLVGASVVVDRAHITNTRAVLQLVSDAVDEWQREQKAKPRGGLFSAKQGNPPATYVSRYGEYPPDELEIFTKKGIPGAGGNGGSLAVARVRAGNTLEVAQIFPAPAPDWEAMHFHPEVGPDAAQNAREHRDQAAMILAIETMGEASAKILADIPAKNRTAGALDENGTPALFLDQPDTATLTAPNGAWDPALDFQIRRIVDDWGVPIGYFAVRDWIPNEPASIANQRKSSNHPAWCEASSWFVRANKGRPLIFSYGPNGKDQLTEDLMDSAGNPAAASLAGDYNDTTNTTNGRGKVDHPLNQDNVYLDSDLTRKLLEGPKKNVPAATTR